MASLTQDGRGFPRRLVSITIFAALFAVTLAAAPLLYLGAALYDATRPQRRWGAVRLMLCIHFYGFMEASGLLGAFALWAMRPAMSAESYLARHYSLQTWWASGLLAALTKLYRLDFKVSGVEVATDGPYLLLMRHTSLGDTLLPIRLLAAPFGMRFRYVMKKSLRWEPCLDIVGGRLPNSFVDRHSSDSAKQAANVATLGDALGPKDAVLLFPEGKRFTPGRRARLIERLRMLPDGSAVEAAEKLKHVLPARRGGVRALLHMHPDLDVVFCAHHGFDGATRLPDLLSGDLIGRTVNVGFWRQPAADRQGQDFEAWLEEQWAAVDRWVGDVRAPQT